MENYNEIKIHLLNQKQFHTLVKKTSKYVDMIYTECEHGYRLALTKNWYINLTCNQNKLACIYARHRKFSNEFKIPFPFYINLNKEYVKHLLFECVQDYFTKEDVQTLEFLEKPTLSSKRASVCYRLSTVEYMMYKDNEVKLYELMEQFLEFKEITKKITE